MNHEELLDAIEEGTWDQGTVQEYVVNEVLTNEQLNFLTDNRLSVVAILNRRYTRSQEPLVRKWMKSVNDLLGWNLFVTV